MRLVEGLDGPSVRVCAGDAAGSCRGAGPGRDAAGEGEDDEGNGEKKAARGAVGCVGQLVQLGICSKSKKPCCTKASAGLPYKCADPSPERRGARIRLVHDLNEAERRTEAATEAFSAITSRMPSGIRHPDSVRRIRVVSDELTIARNEMVRAHHRLNEFLETGTVPEDLKPSGRNSGGASEESATQAGRLRGETLKLSTVVMSQGSTLMRHIHRRRTETRRTGTNYRLFDCYSKKTCQTLVKRLSRVLAPTLKNTNSIRLQTAIVPVRRTDLVKVAGADCEVRMRTQNDETPVLIWVAVLVLLVVALWLKIPLG